MTRGLGNALVVSLLAACSSSKVKPDAGSGLPPSCVIPPDCRAAGFDGACRDGGCLSDVPCEVDLECALGESCLNHQCRFAGCASDADCPKGFCRLASYSCSECSLNADCPASRPVCDRSGTCVAAFGAACRTDADCPAPGPGVCNVATGTCVFCTQDLQCENGLHCGPDHVCHGAGPNQACGPTQACDKGLVCVTIQGGGSVCLTGCNLYAPQCSAGTICYELGFTNSPQIVFDNGAPLGVCAAPIAGRKSLGQPCSTQSLCQPNVACIPDSPTSATCHSFCDPRMPVCPAPLCRRLMSLSLSLIL